MKRLTNTILSTLLTLTVVVPLLTADVKAMSAGETYTGSIETTFSNPSTGTCQWVITGPETHYGPIEPVGTAFPENYMSSHISEVSVVLNTEGHYNLTTKCSVAYPVGDGTIANPVVNKPEAGITVGPKPVSEIKTEERSREEAIQPPVEQEETNDLPKGETRVKREGVPGKKLITWTVQTQDGVEISNSKSEEVETILVHPKPEIVLIGTKVPESGSQEDGGSTHIPKDPEPQPERDTTPKVEQPDNDASEEMPVVKEEPEPEPLNEKDFITEVYVASAHNNMRLDLSPAFTPMGRTYTVDVPKEVKKVRIDIVANDDERLQVKYDKEVEVKEGGQDIMVNIINNGINQRPLKITLKPENSVLFEKSVDGILYYSVKGNTLEDLRLLVGKEFVYNKLGQLLIGKHSLGLVQTKLDDNALLEWRLNDQDGEPKTAVQPLLLMSEKDGLVESDDNKELILLLIDKQELTNNQNPKGLELEELSAKLKTFLVLDKKIQEKPIYGYQLSESEVIVPSVLDYEKVEPYWIVVNTESGAYKRYEIEPTETTVQDKEEKVDIFSLVLLIASLAVIGIMALFALHPKFRTARGLDASNKKESAKDARNANSKVTKPINQNSQDMAKTKVVEIVNIPKNRSK